MSAKHTPGPWMLVTVKTQVGLCHKIGAFPTGRDHRPYTYGCVYEDGMHLWRIADDGTHDSEIKSNARLMAAAPELLAALKRALRDSGCDGDLCMHAWHDDARIAIAKAEGI